MDARMLYGKIRSIMIIRLKHIRLNVCTQRFGQIAQVSLLFVLASLPACGRTTDPKPGDTDYPVENPHPTHFIQFTVTIPPTLAVNFRVTYLADVAAGGPPNTAGTCVRTVGLGVTAPFGVDLPLHLTRDGDTYHGSVAVDAFLPGNCNWRMAFIRYQEARDYGDYAALVQFGFPLQEAHQLHIWCVKDQRSSDPAHPERCGSPFVLTDVIRAEFENEIPLEQRRNARMDTSASAQNISVAFHDFNALPDAHRFLK
jgi:hypothetical protein